MEENPDFFIDNWYTRFCRHVTNTFIKDHGKKRKEWEKLEKEKFKKAEKVFLKVKEQFEEIRKKTKKTDEKFISRKYKFSLAVNVFEKKKKIYEKNPLVEGIKFSRMDFHPYQIEAFGLFALIVTFLSMIMMDLLILVITNLLEITLPNGLIMIISVLTILIPLIVTIYIRQYPIYRANRLKAKSLGRIPETINYMSMSMFLVPSLDKAINFASDSVSEPMSTTLKRVLWQIYTNQFHRIEDSFIAFAMEWGEYFEEFKRSLYMLIGATMEKSIEGISTSLNKANEIIMSGTRRKMEEYADSLSGPSMVLFSIGIILPMIIGCMLPIMGVGNKDLIYIILFMDVFIPLGTLLYAYNILGKRPGTILPPEIKSTMTRRKKVSIILFSGFLFLTGLISGIIAIYLVLSLPKRNALYNILASLPILWGIGLGVSFYCRQTSKLQKMERDYVKKEEEGFPDALFQMGNRIMGGKSLEQAIDTTSESMKGTFISQLFKKIFYNFQISQGTPNTVLFGKKGVLTNHSSKTITTSMKTVLKSVKKDAETSGRIIINISTYIRELKALEQDIQKELSKVKSMMLITAMIFAPVIMGVTCSLYGMLEKSFSEIDLGDVGNTSGAESETGIGMMGMMGGEELIHPVAFNTVIGIYLILTALVIVYFCSGIQYGEEWVERKYFISNTIPISLIFYTFSAILGSMFFN